MLGVICWEAEEHILIFHGIKVSECGQSTLKMCLQWPPHISIHAPWAAWCTSKLKLGQASPQQQSPSESLDYQWKYHYRMGGSQWPQGGYGLVLFKELALSLIWTWLHMFLKHNISHAIKAKRVHRVMNQYAQRSRNKEQWEESHRISLG